MRLQDKIALVTGGTSGIGKRVIERFIEEGATVIFTGRRAALGQEVAQATGARFVQADAADAADAARVVGDLLAQHGRLDILMNNAGGPSQGGPVEDLDLANLDVAYQTHLRGALAHIQAAAPAMRQAGRGSIINVGSIAGHRTGYTTSIFYAVVKAAVIHMTRNVAMDLGEDGVRVNAISPGVIATGIFAKAAGFDHDKAETLVDKAASVIKDVQAIPRAGITDDIAHAAVYLASDEASFVNGEDIVIDGGLIWGLRRSQASATRAKWTEAFNS